MKFLFDTSKMTKKVTEMNEALERVKKKYQEEAQGLFSELTDGFFRAYPEVKIIFWTQYTPHWNDGEECVFRVNEIYYSLDRNFDSKSFGDAESKASEWDLVDDDEDENYYDEAEYDGEQFFERTAKDVEAEIQRYENLLTEDNPKFRSDVMYAFKYDFRKSYYTYSKDSCLKRITELKSNLDKIKKEYEQFPNRDEIIEAIRQVRNFIENIDRNLMKDIFGDHVKVILTKNGSRTVDYDHD